MGRRRCIRGAVPAVFTGRPVRRCIARPLGPPCGVDRCEPGPAPAGDLCGRPTRDRGDGLRGAVWSFGGERVRPVRDVRHVGCTAARGAPPESDHHELGGHRSRCHGDIPRCEFHAAAPLAVRRRRHRGGGNHVPGRHTGGGRAAAGGALPPPRARSRRLGARRPRDQPCTRWPPVGCMEHARRLGSLRSLPRWPDLRRIAWYSASTRSWYS